ncbi:hypothetical protein LguiA_010460 [Lonicera macranthoides]
MDESVEKFLQEDNSNTSISVKEEQENADTSRKFLTELNLLLILSFLSLSTEEFLSCEEIEKMENDAKSAISRSQMHRQQVDQFKAFERRTPKFQTKIRDCRHSRRM